MNPPELRLRRPPPDGGSDGTRTNDPKDGNAPTSYTGACAESRRTLRHPGQESAAKRRLVEQAQLPRPNHRLDARPNAEHRAGLFQVLLDCALGNPEDLADIARALARFSPAQAFELATTEDHQVPPYSGGRYFKLKHTHDAPRARNSRTTLPQELEFNKHNHGATQTGGLSATSWREIRHLLTAHLH